MRAPLLGERGELESWLSQHQHSRGFVRDSNRWAMRHVACRVVVIQLATTTTDNLVSRVALSARLGLCVGGVVEAEY